MKNKVILLFAKFLKGDLFSFSRLLTFLESNSKESKFIINECWKILRDKNVLDLPFVIGFTGPPGAGKSTLVNQVSKELRWLGKSVCVLCVDPSSPFSGGAILGDRIRMGELSGDEKIFIRSFGSRGQLGGLSLSLNNAIVLCLLSRFDYIILETVGVGQTELDVMNVVDAVTVVLVPESGDGVQVMKSGLMEIGDVFCVNKSDRPGAKDLYKEISLHFSEFRIPKSVLLCSAAKKEGVKELLETLVHLQTNFDTRTKRFQDRFKNLFDKLVEFEIKNKISQLNFYQKNKGLQKSPYAIKDLLMKKITVTK